MESNADEPECKLNDGLDSAIAFASKGLHHFSAKVPEIPYDESRTRALRQDVQNCIASLGMSQQYPPEIIETLFSNATPAMAQKKVTKLRKFIKGSNGDTQRILHLILTVNDVLKTYGARRMSTHLKAQGATPTIQPVISIKEVAMEEPPAVLHIEEEKPKEEEEEPMADPPVPAESTTVNIDKAVLEHLMAQTRSRPRLEDLYPEDDDDYYSSKSKRHKKKVRFNPYKKRRYAKESSSSESSEDDYDDRKYSRYKKDLRRQAPQEVVAPPPPPPPQIEFQPMMRRGPRPDYMDHFLGNGNYSNRFS
jgi:hypothetical protein